MADDKTAVKDVPVVVVGNKTKAKCIECGTEFSTYWAKDTKKDSPTYGQIKTDGDGNKVVSQPRCDDCKTYRLGNRRTVKLIADYLSLSNLGNNGYNLSTKNIDEMEEKISICHAECFSKLRRTKGEEVTVFQLSRD